VVSDSDRMGLSSFTENARRMHGELAQAVEDLATVEAVGYADGGLVKAVVSGEGRILELSIDSSVIDPDDPETLSRLVITAIEEANQGIADQRAQQVGGIAEGLRGMLSGLGETPMLTVMPKVPNRTRTVPATPDPRRTA
jgi:DNA-binding YbaB/EbfC family protein